MGFAGVLEVEGKESKRHLKRPDEERRERRRPPVIFSRTLPSRSVSAACTRVFPEDSGIYHVASFPPGAEGGARARTRGTGPP